MLSAKRRQKADLAICQVDQCREILYTLFLLYFECSLRIEDLYIQLKGLMLELNDQLFIKIQLLRMRISSLSKSPACTLKECYKCFKTKNVSVYIKALVQFILHAEIDRSTVSVLETSPPNHIPQSEALVFSHSQGQGHLASSSDESSSHRLDKSPPRLGAKCQVTVSRAPGWREQ